VNDFDIGLIGEVHGFIGNGDGTFDNFYTFPTSGLVPTRWQLVISTWTATWI